MVYCYKCGKKNDDDSEFCTKCGVRLDKQKEEATFEDRINKTANQIEEKAERFGKSIEKASKRFETRMNHSFEEFQKWYDARFKILGPLIWSFLGLIILRFIILLLDISRDEHIIFGELSDFLYLYLLLFFGLMLLNTYNSYLKRRYNKQYRWISPTVTTISFTVSLWIFSKFLVFLDNNLDMPVLTTIGNFIDTYIILVFVIVLLISYGFVMVILPFSKKSEDK
jgi:hypothetical protein